jgi:tetratricopeptide (TPR) repeat protein
MCTFALTFALSAFGAPGEQAAEAEREMAIADDFMSKRNYQAAIAHYQAARILAPGRPGPYRALGMAYFAAGQCREAVPALEEYLRRKPDDPRPEAVDALRQCKGGRPAAPKPSPMAVRITSDPSGAEVHIDDENGPIAGYTPFDSEELPAGVHRVWLVRPDYKTASGEIRVRPGVAATLHMALVPKPAAAPPVEPPPPRATLEQRKREAWERARMEAERTTEESVRVQYERDKMDLCGSGPEYQFCDVNAKITENDFVRRYKRVTGQKDLDYALKMRNKTAIAVWASIGLAGVAALAYGAATYNTRCTPADTGISACDGAGGMPDTSKFHTTDLAKYMLFIGLGVHLGSSAIFLLYGGTKPDGKPTDHLIAEFDARLAVDRYNRALMSRLRSGTPMRTLLDTPPPAPHRPRVTIAPYVGIGGAGIVGSF